MACTVRWYQGEDDYWRMWDFLRRVYLTNGYRQLSWHVARFDYARCCCLNCAGVGLDEVALIWEEGGHSFIPHARRRKGRSALHDRSAGEDQWA